MPPAKKAPARRPSHVARSETSARNSAPRHSSTAAMRPPDQAPSVRSTRVTREQVASDGQRPARSSATAKACTPNGAKGPTSLHEVVGRSLRARAPPGASSNPASGSRIHVVEAARRSKRKKGAANSSVRRGWVGTIMDWLQSIHALIAASLSLSLQLRGQRRHAGPQERALSPMGCLATSTTRTMYATTRLNCLIGLICSDCQD